MNPENLKSGDSDDLEALFDEIAEQRVWDEAPEAAAPADKPQLDAKPAQSDASDDVFAAGDAHVEEDPHDVFRRVGALTRKLHDALHELGYDKSVENAVNTLPDARARLEYIADLTGKAAEKVLAAVESTQKINDELSSRASELDAQWDRLYNNEMTLEEFKSHARENREFIKDISQNSGQMGSHLTDIMMAQDFHDLTGQVVNRIATMAQGLEEQLVQLLLDTTPADQRKQVEENWLSGPAMNADGRTDVCANQGQVDDLLESLGF
jgi:chemotaxis protein CheZ